MKATLAVLLLLVLMLGYLDLVLTTNGQHKDALAGPFMIIAAMAVLVLAVGLVERITKGPDRSER